MKISDTHSFLKQLPYFTNPSLFMGKIWIPFPFFENFENSTPTRALYKGQASNCTNPAFLIKVYFQNYIWKISLIFDGIWLLIFAPLIVRCQTQCFVLFRWLTDFEYKFALNLSFKRKQEKQLASSFCE